MTTTLFGDPGSFAPARGAFRPGVVRAFREIAARRSAGALLLCLDDSTLATFGYDRRAIEEVGRQPLAL